MRLIIAGGRDYQFTAEDLAFLDALHRQIGVTEVVSGAAPGADACGEAWAIANRIPVKLFPADWDKHGRAAGPIRNGLMAEYADGVALFPGGRGTASMKRLAMQRGIHVYDCSGRS